MNKRVLKYFIGNGIFTASLYFGYIGEITGAQNISTFIIWCTFIVSFFYFSDDFIETNRKKLSKRIVSQSFDISFDILVTGFLVWHSEFFLGAIYFFHMLKLIYDQDRIKDLTPDPKEQN